MKKRIIFLVLALAGVFTLIGQTKFGQDINVSSGSNSATGRITMNMSQMQFMIERSGGGTELYYGATAQKYTTALAMSVLFANSCSNFIQITIDVNGKSTNACINVAWVDIIDVRDGKTRLRMLNGSVFYTNLSYPVVSNLFATCLSSGGTGTTNLTFATNGASVNLLSSTGTDVTITPAAGIQVAQSGGSTMTITNTGDTDASNDLTTTTTFGGDVSGAYNNLIIAVNAVTSAKILNGTITTSDLAFSPFNTSITSGGALGNLAITDAGGTLTVPILDIAPVQLLSAGAGISANTGPGGAVTIANTGDTNGADDITTATTATGDLSGTYPGPVVAKIQGRNVSASAPTSGYVLKWNGSQWAPAVDQTGVGSISTNAPLTGDGSPGDPIALAELGFGAGAFLIWDGSQWIDGLVATDPTLQGAGTSDDPLLIAQQGAATGEVLKWNGTSWAPGVGTVLDTLHITQTAHQFLKGQVLFVQNGFGVKADADSIAANCVVISRTSANAYIVQFSGITDSLEASVPGTIYYTSSIKGEVTNLPPLKMQVAYRGVGPHSAELVFGPVTTTEEKSIWSYVNSTLRAKPGSLVAYYPMNETSGTTLNDRSPNGYNGTYSANTVVNQSGFGDGQPAFDMSAATAYATASVAGVLANVNGDEGAIAGWVYLSSAMLIDGNEHFVWYMANGSGAISIKKNTTNYTLQFTYRSINQFVVIQPGWNHLAFTWSKRQNRVVCYVNGIVMPDTGGVTNPKPNWTGGAITSCMIGQVAISSSTSIGGKMQSWGIWKEALSLNEINRLSSPGACAPIAHSQFKTTRQRVIMYAPAGDPNDHIGRPSMCQVSSSYWIMIFRAGLSHNDTGGDTQHIAFSSDQGETWSKWDTLLDGVTKVVGWPIPMTGAVTNSSIGPLIKYPSGKLTAHIFEETVAGHETRQYSSTDNGATWANDGIKFPFNIIAEEDYTHITSGANAGTYVIARDINVLLEKTRVYKTTNEGVTWTLRGSPEIVIDANECGIEHLGGDTMIAIIKTSDASGTWRYYSYDAGANWTSRQDLTSQVGEVNKPMLVQFGSRLYLHGRKQLRKTSQAMPYIQYSTDKGQTWSEAFYPDSLRMSGDNGYTDMLMRTNGDIYLASYQGQYNAANMVDYIVRDSSISKIYQPTFNKYYETAGVLKSRYPGAPVSIGTVSLTSEVNGILPPANGGWNISTLTDNYITRANGSTNVENSILYDDGTLVGIGAAAAPEAKLHVKKSDVSGTVTSVAAVGWFEYGADNAVLGLQTGDTRFAQLQMGDPIQAAIGGMRYYMSNYSGKPNRLSLYTDGFITAAMTIDSLRRVMIGSTEIPKVRLHVYENAVSQTPQGDVSFLIEKGSDDAAMQFLSAAARRGSIFWGDPTNTALGILRYDLSSGAKPNTFVLSTAGTQRMTLGLGLSIGSGTFTEATGIINAQTGFRVNNAATSGQYLRGNGTNFVSSTIPLSDIAAAGAAATIDNLNFGQIWNWSTMTTGTARTFGYSGLTTGLGELQTANALTTGSIQQISTTNNSLNSTLGLAYITNNGTSTSGKVFRAQSNGTDLESGLTVMASGKVGIGEDNPTEVLEINGNLNLKMAGNKIKIATGTNASAGTATLVAGTVTINTTAVTSSSIIIVVYDTPAGTLASGLSAPTGSIVNGTSFVINSVTTAGAVNITDTSTVKWFLIN